MESRSSCTKSIIFPSGFTLRVTVCMLPRNLSISFWTISRSLRLAASLMWDRSCGKKRKTMHSAEGQKLPFLIGSSSAAAFHCVWNCSTHNFCFPGTRCLATAFQLILGFQDFLNEATWSWKHCSNMRSAGLEMPFCNGTYSYPLRQNSLSQSQKCISFVIGSVMFTMWRLSLRTVFGIIVISL